METLSNYLTEAGVVRRGTKLGYNIIPSPGKTLKGSLGCGMILHLVDPKDDKGLWYCITSNKDHVLAPLFYNEDLNKTKHSAYDIVEIYTPIDEVEPSPMKKDNLDQIISKRGQLLWMKK